MNIWLLAVSMNRSSLALSLALLALSLGSETTTLGQQRSSGAVASEDKSQVLLGSKVILNAERDGFMSVHKIVYSPDNKRFVVIGCGFECTDNEGFLFVADGKRRRDFTGRWDHILSDKLEWSNDSKTVYYYRINSTGADPPKNAPAEGWIAVDVATGRKSSGKSRRLEKNRSYSVFDTANGLAVRAGPGVQSKEVGRLAADAKGIFVTGPAKRVGGSIWVPIRSDSVSGWVNQRFLYVMP